MSLLSCKTCRAWNATEDGRGECRLNPPITAWPITCEEDWCAQHSNRTITGGGKEPRASDMAILEILRKSLVETDGRIMTRSYLVKEILGKPPYNLSETAAISRLKTMLRRNLIEQGQHPNPDPLVPEDPGVLYVWPTEHAATYTEAPPAFNLVITEEEFLRLVQELAPTAAQATSFRKMYKHVLATVRISMTTAHNKFTALLKRGLIVRCDNRYYAPVDKLEIE